MTDLRTAAQQALERLRKYHHGNGFADDAECIASLEAALAQEQAEPLTEDEMRGLADDYLSYQDEGYEASGVFALIRAVERAHGIGGGNG